MMESFCWVFVLVFSFFLRGVRRVLESLVWGFLGEMLCVFRVLGCFILVGIRCGRGRSVCFLRV